METKKIKIYSERNHVLELICSSDCTDQFLSWLKYDHRPLFIFDSDSSSHTFAVFRDKIVAVEISSLES